MRVTIVGLMAALGIASPLCAQTQTSRCGPISDSSRTADNWRPQPGEYRLTMVAVAGARRGQRATGALWLWPTRADDRSPITGAPPERVDTIATPLYGATDLDLLSVGVVLSDDYIIPRPWSRDPIYPGVLLHIQNWGQSTRLRQSVMTIGTQTNIRARLDFGMTDGPGTGLWVRRVTPDGFRGTWTPWGGLREAGSGYFCASRVRAARVKSPAG